MFSPYWQEATSIIRCMAGFLKLMCFGNQGLRSDWKPAAGTKENVVRPVLSLPLPL
jgi:hypothetical protein